jgi:hypothetical protein
VPDPQVERAVEHAVEIAVADAEPAFHLPDGHTARVHGFAEHLPELEEVSVGYGGWGDSTTAGRWPQGL